MNQTLASFAKQADPARASASQQERALPAPVYAGNQAILRPLSRIPPRMQCKLEIGAVDDPLEAEADRAADHVMRMPAPPPSDPNSAPVLRRECAACEEEDKKLQKKAAGPAVAGAEAPQSVRQALGIAGRPLDASARAFMEPRFGRDLSHVRLHTGSQAEQSASDVHARAYTVGHDMVFGRGQYNPASSEGRHLLAHELSHTVQQSAQPQLIQRAPANYGSSAQPDTAASKAKPQMTENDVMGFLVTYRYLSQEQLVNFLVRNEAQLDRLLERFGFKGGWVKSEDYLKDFDAAAARWDKAGVARYRQKAVQSQAAPPPKPKSREELKFEEAQRLQWQLENYPKERFQVNDMLESAGLMDDLVGLQFVVDGKERTFEKEGRGSHVAGPYYSRWASAALGFSIGVQGLKTLIEYPRKTDIAQWIRLRRVSALAVSQVV